MNKTLSLPEDVHGRLSREANASATVVEALRMYWEHKDTIKRLASHVGEIEGMLRKNTYQSITNPKQKFDFEVDGHILTGDELKLMWNRDYSVAPHGLQQAVHKETGEVVPARIVNGVIEELYD